jgi:CMD domain protein
VLTADTDVIDFLAGIEPGTRIDAIRALRPQARENAQKSFRALFAPAESGGVTLPERHAVASFVALLHGSTAAPFYAARLAEQDGGSALAGVIAAEAARGATEGPYGKYPEGTLSIENKAGPTYQVLDETRARLGSRLTAALRHAHLLLFCPRDADAAAIQALLDAGWSSDGIVTLSQLVASLSFQLRVVAGLRALAAQD